MILKKAEKGNDVITFRGWKSLETELDDGLEIEPMKMAGYWPVHFAQ